MIITNLIIWLEITYDVIVVVISCCIEYQIKVVHVYMYSPGGHWRSAYLGHC